MTWGDWAESSYNTGGFSIQFAGSVPTHSNATIVNANGISVNYSGEDVYATDSIVSGRTYITDGGASLITFTIDGTEYQAEDGMTWEGWLESAYNTANYSYLLLEGVDTVLLESINSAYHYGLSYNDAFVPITDTIVADRAYTKRRGAHSGGPN
jgi:hypothetical protein